MNRSRAVFAFALSVALLLGTTSPAPAVSRSELQQHRRAADEARKRAAAAEALAKKLAGEVAALDGRIEQLQAETDALDSPIAAATKRSAALQAQVASLRSECRSLESEIASTQVEFDLQRSLLADRVQSTYKQGTWFYLDMLLGAQNFNDLITRTELVNRVIESNNNIAAGLSRTKDSLTRDKVKLQRSLDQAALKRREAEQVEAELRQMQDSRQYKVNLQASVQSQKTTLMKNAEADAARARALEAEEERESDRIAAQLAASGGSGVFAGTMAWPVPASHRITSPFGPRICPFHGREMHKGIDIGAPMGSSIVSAADGTVIYAGYRGSYGNTLMVDHGNGVVTLYAHQASGGFKVGNGDKVSKGQRIGTVGSTGSSTGPHLHFEVRVNGVPKNPVTYQ